MCIFRCLQEYSSMYCVFQSWAIFLGLKWKKKCFFRGQCEKNAVLYQNKRFSRSKLPRNTYVQKILCSKIEPKFSNVRMHNLCCLISWLLLMLGKRSLFYCVEETLPFTLNTKQPLSDKWLLKY